MAKFWGFVLLGQMVLAAFFFLSGLSLASMYFVFLWRIKDRKTELLAQSFKFTSFGLATLALIPLVTLVATGMNFVFNWQFYLAWFIISAGSVSFYIVSRFIHSSTKSN